MTGSRYEMTSLRYEMTILSYEVTGVMYEMTTLCVFQMVTKDETIAKMQSELEAQTAKIVTLEETVEKHSAIAAMIHNLSSGKSVPVSKSRGDKKGAKS